MLLTRRRSRKRRQRGWSDRQSCLLAVPWSTWTPALWLARATVPVISVPIELPWTRFSVVPSPVIHTPYVPLAEITLSSAQGSPADCVTRASGVHLDAAGRVAESDRPRDIGSDLVPGDDVPIGVVNLDAVVCRAEITLP